MRRPVLFAMTLALVAPVARSAEMSRLPSRVVRVAAWKNGLAAVTREVDMPSRPGRYLVDMPSPPLHGTLWTALPPKARVVEVAAIPDAVGDTTTLVDVACAAIGRDVVVGMSGQEPPTMKGRVVSAPCETGSLTPGMEAYAGYRLPWGLVQLQTEEGLASVAMGLVTSLHVLGAAPENGRGTPALVVELGDVAGARFELTWLTRGLAWAPAALLELESPTRGTLSTSATLVNEAEDLADVTFDLVSGPATFSMGNVQSPLAGSALLAFLQSIAGRGSGFDVTQMVMQNGPSPSVGTGMSALTARLDAASGVELAREDASIRRLEHVGLARRARSWRPLWSEGVSVTHVHRWQVPSTLQERGPVSASSEQGPQHVLRVVNATQNPWTSQPVEIVSGGAVVGQSTVPYTPAGATVDIVLADALDLKAEASETETARRSDPAQPYRARVALSGTLVVENLTGAAVTLEVTKEIEGDLSRTEPRADVRKIGQGAKPLNPRQRLSWTMPLAAGATVTLAYDYESWL